MTAQLVPTVIVVFLCILGSIIAVTAVVYLIKKCCCKEKKPSSELGGIDNPLVASRNSIGHGAVPQPEPDSDASSLKEVVTDGLTQHPTTNGISPLPEVDDTHAQQPQDGDDEIFTVLLDQKSPPTNGFDVMPGDDGDVVVSDVRHSGPANNKLKQEKKPSSELGGIDNPLVASRNSIGHGAVPQPEPDSDASSLKEVVTDGLTQHPTTNGISPLPEVDDTHAQPPQDGDDEIFTVLLDQKSPPTNGFDVMPGDDGDVVVSDVRHSGPANNMLKQGDVIDSVTVFFDSMKYEDALSILSNAAPYKVAVTASRKPKDERNASEQAIEKWHKDLEKEKKVKEKNQQREDDAISSSSSSLSSNSSLSDDAVTDLQVAQGVASVETKAPKSKDTSSESGSYLETIGSPEKQEDPRKEDPREEYTKDEEPSNEDKKEENNPVAEEENKPKEELRTAEEDDIKEQVVEEVTALQSPDESTYQGTEEPIPTPAKKREEIVFTSGWRRVVKLLDLFKTGLVTEDTIKKLEFGEVEEKQVAQDLQQYLHGEEPIAGLLFDNGDVMSLYDATKQGIIRRGTAVSLLEAQAATGSIINPQNGKKMTVVEATKQGLIDRQFEALLIRAERAVLGYQTKLSPVPLSLFDAMQRKLVVESHGIRLLEAQIATGGIIDPHANHRLPVDAAFDRGLFDRRLHGILEDPSDDTKGFFDPNTNENLTYLELMQRCVIDKDTDLRLLPFHKNTSPKT